jgi:hypothetical protein
LAQIVERRAMKLEVDWGTNERLKVQVEQAGFGIALTKLQRNVAMEE